MMSKNDFRMGVIPMHHARLRHLSMGTLRLIASPAQRAGALKILILAATLLGLSAAPSAAATPLSAAQESSAKPTRAMPVDVDVIEPNVDGDPSVPPDAGDIDAVRSQSPIPASWSRVIDSRRPIDDELMMLRFESTPVLEILGFIAESTGKTLMYQPHQVMSVTVTLLMTEAQSRSGCLDRLYEALVASGLAVVEDDLVVCIDHLTNTTSMPRPPLWVAPNEDIEQVSSDGVVADVCFAPRHISVASLAEQLRTFVPPYTLIFVDADRNQLLVQSTAGVAKRVARHIAIQDRPATHDESSDTDVTGVGVNVVPPDKRPALPRRFRPRTHLANAEIDALTRARALEELAEVASDRQWGGVSAERHAQLKREMDALIERIRRAEP